MGKHRTPEPEIPAKSGDLMKGRGLFEPVTPADGEPMPQIPKPEPKKG